MLVSRGESAVTLQGVRAKSSTVPTLNATELPFLTGQFVRLIWKSSIVSDLEESKDFYELRVMV